MNSKTAQPNYSRATVKHASPLIYRATLLLRPTDRNCLWPVLAFYLSVGVLCDVRPTEARVLINRRKNALRGAPNPNDPLWSELVGVIKINTLPTKPFIEILDALNAHIAFRPPGAIRELEARADQLFGNLAMLSAMALGATDRSKLIQLRQLGAAMRLTDLLQRLARDHAYGRMYLPTNLLTRLHIHAHDLVSPRSEPELVIISNQIGQIAKYHFDTAWPAIDCLPVLCRPFTRIMARGFRRLQDRSEFESGRLANGRLRLSVFDLTVLSFMAVLDEIWALLQYPSTLIRKKA